MTTQRTDLGDNLVNLVRTSGLTQVQMAQLTGYTEQHISQMMRQRAGSVVAWDRLLRIAGAQITPDTCTVTDCPRLKKEVWW